MKRATLHPQTQSIAERRRLLQPSPVQRGHVPQWLAVACRRGLGIKSPRNYDAFMAAVCRTGGGTWLDHYGSTTHSDGTTAFVSEPYDLTASDFKAINRLCGTIGARWGLSANSWHFPGKTLRITIRQPDTA